MQMTNRWKIVRPILTLLIGSACLIARGLSQERADYSSWKHSGSMWLLTTAEGASLPAEAQVDQFPVLIRLHRDSFDFSQAQPHGEDLRFSTSVGEPMAYQIDDWDPSNGVASVWVRIPSIVGNSRQEIKVHWGNPLARSESDGTKVFRRADGYLSVWHMNQTIHDSVGTLSTVDRGTTDAVGVIGSARHFGDRKGVMGGEKISSYPIGSQPHTTELWFRPEIPNATLIGWGNEQAQGKVVMQFRSPPHLRMDCYFSRGSVEGKTRVPIGEWTQVVHTYRDGESKLYVNGILDTENRKQGGPLNIRSPSRLYLGGWYNNFDYVGDLDEVRISDVVRSAEWIQLQFENQKPYPLLVGPLVSPGDTFLVSPERLELAEGQKGLVNLQAGGAQKIYWILNREGRESIVATDRFHYEFDAGRIPRNASKPELSGTTSEAQTTADHTTSLYVRAIYGDKVVTKEIPITIREDIPEPQFQLIAPTSWDGRREIEIVPEVSNLASLQAKGASHFRYHWSIDGVAVAKKEMSGKLLLKRSLGSGEMRVRLAIDNGGAPTVRTCLIDVREPDPFDEASIARPLLPEEQPEDDQFIAREGNGRQGSMFGQLVYAGKLDRRADSVFVRVFAGEKLFATERMKVSGDGTYALKVNLKGGLVKYRTEFGSQIGDQETVLHSAKNIVCGDAFLIIGQSNAVATDFGKENPLVSSDWVRTFGSTAGDAEGARWKGWANAEARSPGGKSQIGYWGMELGRRLVESEGIPICIINGAVGGTRIDQHQRNDLDPTDVTSIYGRLLWRVQQARLTHGIRGILWHQGENDQGADGPTGGYGYETYRQYFVDLAASWKEDYPNVERYYAFQIWPKSCAMGIDGSDNRLREVQRRLPEIFSKLSILSTLGIKPPGGCHFPAAGYAEFAKLLHPMMQHQLYQREISSFHPPNLKRAYFSNPSRDEITLEFDQAVVWSDSLIPHFHVNGETNSVASASAKANKVFLRLKGRTIATTVTYLDSSNWDPERLLVGENGLAAFSFCEVPIQKE